MAFHCILLLEDIDATKPLTRAGSAAKVPSDEVSDGKDCKKKNQFTLSGLLNAIDGVGAAEGKSGHRLCQIYWCAKAILTWYYHQGAF